MNQEIKITIRITTSNNEIHSYSTSTILKAFEYNNLFKIN